MKKYYHITAQIILPFGDTFTYSEVIDKSPLEYILHYKNLGGTYSNRVILYSNEITEEEYNRYSPEINEN